MEYGKIAIHSQSTVVFILRHVHRTAVFGMLVHLTRNLIQVCRAGRSRVTPTAVPRSCCRIDIKGPCYIIIPFSCQILRTIPSTRARHSTLSRTYESHCRGDTLFLDCANRPSLRLAATYQIGRNKHANSSIRTFARYQRSLVVNFSFTACAIISVSLLKHSILN